MKTYNKVVNKKEGKMMINKFSDFLNTEPKNNKKEDKSNETTKNFDNIDKNFSERDKKGYEDMINQYSGYSQEELMKELEEVGVFIKDGDRYHQSAKTLEFLEFMKRDEQDFLDQGFNPLTAKNFREIFDKVFESLD